VSTFAGFLDDAAMFPPGNAPTEAALEAHRRYRAEPFGVLLGPLLCADSRLPELAAALTRDTAATSVPLGVVVTGGAGAIGPAIAWASRTPLTQLRSIEVALRDEDDLAHNARRVCTVLSNELPSDVTAFVETPRTGAGFASPAWESALDVIAESGHCVKYRTGGPDHAAFPDEVELARCITAALDRELAFKCTAGLHHAIRSTTGDAGEQHGFLNILLATRASLDGATVDEIAGLLAGREPDQIVSGIGRLDGPAGVSARRWFRSFGTCSITEPVDDLVALGLLGKEAA
jgi:hypothetical protein